MQGRARGLWGRYPDFLEPDPDPVPVPDVNDPGIDPSGTLSFYYGSTPSGINPIVDNDADLTVWLKSYTFDYVAKRHYKNPGKYAPGLARRVEVSPDYKEWVIWLRPGVLWHPPRVDLDRYPHLRGEHEVTAHDAKFTLDLIQNPDSDCGHLRPYYTDLVDVEVVDDYCYIARWSRATVVSIEYNLASVYFIPKFIFAYDEAGEPYAPEEVGLAFNDHWFPREGNWVGSGPYYVADYDENSHWLFKRYENYWGQRPPIRELRGLIFSDLKARVDKLEAGETDIALLTALEAQQKKDQGAKPFIDGSLSEVWTWSTGTAFIAYKNTHPIFSDVKVRHAMTHAADRKRMIETINLGHGAVITGPQHVQSVMNPPGLEPLAFDLDKAKRLLAEAGWEDTDEDGILDKVIDGVRKPFHFTAMVPNNNQFRPVFEIFKEDLLKIGVKMDLDLLFWKQFAERLDARTFEVTGLVWSSSGWESFLRQIWHSDMIKEVPSSNFIEFSDPELDRLCDETETEFDLEKRIELQRRAHTRIWELQPYTWLFTIRRPVTYWKDRLSNVEAGSGYLFRPFVRWLPMGVRSPR